MSLTKEKPYFWSEVWNENEFKSNYKLLRTYLERSLLFKVFLEVLHRGSVFGEIGCGSGLFTLELSRKFSLRCYLFDISQYALRLATLNSRRLGIKKAKIRYGDILRIPLPPNFLDVIWSGGVNEHLVGRDREKAIEEMIRVVKPGGYVIIQVPHSSNPFYRLGVKFRKIIGKWKLLEIPYSSGEFNLIFKKLMRKGIQIKRFKILKYGFLASIIWLIPGRFYIVKKISSFLCTIKLPFLDEFGDTLLVVIQKG